ncbi:MAG TPA: putative lipopolysaccharide heptosyltransferase III [Nitrospiraceae bacterium]|nr:putative lipopolysaccharide heptosyltransferase III [Nitrospiraceae bacterium]
MSFTNILVIKLRHIGDVLLATPVLRTLKEAFPQARLTALVNRGTESVLRHHPDLDEILIAEKGTMAAQLRFLRKLRRKRFDCVVDLTDGDRSAFMSLATRAKTRIGFNAEHRWRGLLYTHVVKPSPEDAHRIEYDLAAVRSLGLTSATARPTLYLSSDEELSAKQVLNELSAEDGRSSKLIIIQPGARYPLKVWPGERFAELADRLVRAVPCRILLGGDSGERSVAEAVRDRTQCRPTVIAGRLSLLEFGALLKQCDLFIGNDGGAMHMAAAVGTPVVALFGPTYPQRWGPRGAPSEILYKGLDCRACYHPVCIRGEQNCMRLISVDEVFERCMRLLTTSDREAQSSKPTERHCRQA